MNNFKELWHYFHLIKNSEFLNSLGKIHLGFILFNKSFQGFWIQLFLISVVYLIVKIRYNYTDMGEFKFTVNYIIDTDDDNSKPLGPQDIEYFQLNKMHPRLMQLTIGPSIYGDNWIKDLKLRIADIGEKYQNTYIYGVGVNLYGAKKPETIERSMDTDVLMNSIWEIIKEQPDARLKGEDLKDEDQVYHQFKAQYKDEAQGYYQFKDNTSKGNYISTSKPDKNTKVFLVGDIETIIVENIHVPYAMGYVFAGEKGTPLSLLKKPVTYCTENNYYSGDFQQRSRLMFNDFLSGLISYSKKHGTKRVYFHNLSRFDGILLLKLLLEDKSKWLIKPIIREHNVYQVIIYDKSKPKIPVLDFRDSLKLLPGSLKSLAETMCPELGGKGSIPHEELNEFNISEKKEELMLYLEQDICILAGVLRKTQEKYYNRYLIDITNSLTVSSMAMKIYRTHYYPKTYPIYRPEPNKSAFIRRGYYGGHTDVYIPYGKGLFYYDVNSLYPYAMTKPMPSGKPVWIGNFKGCDLEQLFGFVEAKVTCPDSIKIPFLPYRNPKTGTLIFPTGTFTGVYFTEELKLAVKLGYKLELRHGYLFEKRESPFSEFVKEIYEERLEAKKNGDQVMSSLHKLTMNSLYGRFGIKPECNITEICDRDKLEDLMSIYQFGEVEPLNETHYVISYTGTLQRMKGHPLLDFAKSRLHWKQSINNNSTSAVQMSAAITAYARIHMYPYISLPGCHYTDTDSVALDKQLPDSEVSSVELGKLKLEHKIVEGYFLAPKCYALVLDEYNNIIRNKGLAKDKVDLSWFIEQYKNLGRVIKSTYKSSFKINWPKLNIYRASIMLNLGIDPSTKRNLVIDDNNIWVDTLPLKVLEKSVTRPDKPTKSNLQPTTPQSESKPSMQQAESKPNRSDEAETERLHSTVTILEEQLQIERSARKVIEEQLQIEHSARKVLEKRLQAIELMIQTSRLKEGEGGHLSKKEDQGHSTNEGTSSPDKSKTMGSQPTEQKNGKTDSPSKIVKLQQDWDKEPSKRCDRNKGKRDPPR